MTWLLSQTGKSQYSCPNCGCSIKMGIVRAKSLTSEFGVAFCLIWRAFNRGLLPQAESMKGKSMRVAITEQIKRSGRIEDSIFANVLAFWRCRRFWPVLKNWRARESRRGVPIYNIRPYFIFAGEWQGSMFLITLFLYDFSLHRSI